MKKNSKEERKAKRKENSDINSCAALSFSLIALSCLLLGTQQIKTDAFFQLLVGILTLMATMGALIITRRGINDSKNQNIQALNATMAQMRIDLMNKIFDYLGHYASFNTSSSILHVSLDGAFLTESERMTVRNLLPKSYEKFVKLESLRSEMSSVYSRFCSILSDRFFVYDNPTIHDFFNSSNFQNGIDEVELENLKKDTILWDKGSKPQQALSLAYEVIDKGRIVITEKEALRTQIKEEVENFIPKQNTSFGK